MLLHRAAVKTEAIPALVHLALVCKSAWVYGKAVNAVASLGAHKVPRPIAASPNLID